MQPADPPTLGSNVTKRVPNALWHAISQSSEAGSYLRLIDSSTTQLKAQGPSRTCNESKEEDMRCGMPVPRRVRRASVSHPEILYEMCSNLETFWQ